METSLRYEKIKPSEKLRCEQLLIDVISEVPGNAGPRRMLQQDVLLPTRIIPDGRRPNLLLGLAKGKTRGAG